MELIFVHGALVRDGEWWWHRAAALIEERLGIASRAGWQGVDSTYLVCGDDRSTSIELQRFHAARATRAVELPTGHHPFLSRPELVVEQIELLARRA